MALFRVTISGRAHRFYGTFMGGEIDHLTNLTIRGLNREVPQIVFYTLANHKGWGVALQDFPISATPSRPLEGVVYGFEVAGENLSAVVSAAEERKLKFHGPVEYAAPCPIKESLFVLDPDGNTMELCIRREPVSDKPQGKIMPLRRISHVRVEVTDLDQGKSWYRDTFGLTEDKQVPGEEQATLTVPNTGQLVILAWSIKSRSAAPVRSKVRISIFASRPSCTRRFSKSSIVKNTTGDRTRRKYHGMNRAAIRCTVTIRSVTAFRLAIGSKAGRGTE